MLVTRTRSGLTESIFRTSAVAVDGAGRTLLEWGDPDDPVFYRSAMKPLQATVSQECGANLAPEELAVACASHDGSPVHVALVRSMLAGVPPGALQTPRDWPLGARGRRRLWCFGVKAKAPVYHTCSGKHAAWLRAAVMSDWPTATYLDPGHPIQVRIREVIAETTGMSPEPVGVDGCGAPTARGTIRGLANAFAAFGTNPRFAEAADVTARYPALVAGTDRLDARLAVEFAGPLKVGAEGLVAASRPGVGIAVGSESGDREAAIIAMAEAMRRLGLLSTAPDDLLSRPLYGGDEPVGSLAAVPE